jgi:hypothetical protein
MPSSLVKFTFHLCLVWNPQLPEENLDVKHSHARCGMFNLHLQVMSGDAYQTILVRLISSISILGKSQYFIPST